jgi:SSS family solute:Na+ symporter
VVFSAIAPEPLRAFRGRLSPGAEILGGRLFTLAVAAAVYVLSLTWNESVFDISRKAFEGYITLVPTLILGMRWDRFRAPGAAASILVGNAVLALGWLWPGFPAVGFLPAFWSFTAAWIAAIAVTLILEPPAGRPGLISA